MAAKLILILSAQVLLIQSVFCQSGCGRYGSCSALSGLSLPSLASVSGNSAIENTVVIGNNAGIGGVGLANTGLLGSNIGLANTGLLGSGINLANTGLLGAGVGLANTGIAGSGLSGIGLANTVLPATGPGYLDLVSVSGGGSLPINSYSLIAPAGLNVVSENAIEGPLAIYGQLPFLSAVAFEGALASEGAAAAGCGCGTSGNIGIISENYGPVAAPALGGLGYGAGLGLNGLYF
ncbi:uncharacterized protein ACR2FA_009909 [Aphomia sociella]